eukprot:11985057-Prorocentrum_lima.AAC.1
MATVAHTLAVTAAETKMLRLHVQMLSQELANAKGELANAKGDLTDAKEKAKHWHKMYYELDLLLMATEKKPFKLQQGWGWNTEEPTEDERSSDE